MWGNHPSHFAIFLDRSSGWNLSLSLTLSHSLFSGYVDEAEAS